MYKVSRGEKAKLCLKYINIFTPGHPPLGYPNRADCVIAQAFGRTMFTDSDISIILGCLNIESDPIDSFETLTTEDSFDSGKPNIELAEECYRVLEEYKIPIFAQWEVAFEMYKLDPNKYSRLEEMIFPIWPDSNTKSFTTNDVLNKIKENMKENHLKNPLLVANNWMSIRAAFLIKKRIGTYPVLTHLGCNSFNPESTQKWTRNYLNWVFKEFFVRIHHLLFRWV